MKFAKIIITHGIMEPFTNYGSKEEPLYLISNIVKISGVPRQTINDQIKKLDDIHLVIESVKILSVRNSTCYPQKKKCRLLTLNGLRNVLCSVRRSIKKNILDYYQISEMNKFQCEEAKWLDAIAEAFQGEKIIFQYMVCSYRLDAYFPEYDIVIEVDEPGHKYYKFIDQLERTVAINFNLKNPTIIRINIAGDVSIFKIINKISKVIKTQLLGI